MRIHGLVTASRSAGAQIKVLKSVIEKIREEGRLLLSEETKTELEDIFRQAGGDIATIEENLSHFARTSFRSKTFAINQPVEN